MTKYKFRNLPCNIVDNADLWCVSGSFQGMGAGVLEWCYDSRDALAILREMRKDRRASGLSIHPYRRK